MFGYLRSTQSLWVYICIGMNIWDINTSKNRCSYTNFYIHQHRHANSAANFVNKRISSSDKKKTFDSLTEMAWFLKTTYLNYYIYYLLQLPCQWLLLSEHYLIDDSSLVYKSWRRETSQSYACNFCLSGYFVITSCTRSLCGSCVYLQLHM